MSQWSDRIINHPVHAIIATLQQHLEQAEVLVTQQDATNAVEAVHRLKSIAGLLAARLRSLDPEIVHPQTLTEIQTAVTNTANQVGAYVTNQNVAHLDSANTNADAILLSIAQLGALLTDPEVDSVREAVIGFRRSAGQHLRHFEDEIRPLTADVAKLKKELQQTQSEIESQRSKASTVAAEFQGQFSAAQEKRLNEFNETLKEHKARLAEIETTWDEAMEKATSAHGENSTEVFDQFKTDSAQLLKETEEAFHAKLANHDKAAADGIAKLDEHRREAEKLVGIIGTAGVTSGYQKAANGARYATWFWQVIALGAMGWLVWIAVEMFLPIMTGNFSWPSLAGRVFVSLTIGVLAGYAAHQGTRYHDIERRNRRIELELASLGPYLASLPIEKQQEFKLQMADRMFGREEPSRDGEPAPPTSVSDLLKSEVLTAKLRELAISAVKEIK